MDELWLPLRPDYIPIVSLLYPMGDKLLALLGGVNPQKKLG